ncbi:MAG: metallophosphoesterase [Bacteroidales bacterium]
MKNYQFIVFFSIVITIYLLANAYIFFKGYNAFQFKGQNKILYTVIFIVLAITFIAAKFLESRHSSVFTDALNIIGGFWLGFMLYAIMFFLISDIVFIFLRISGLLGSGNILSFRRWVLYITSGLSVLLITCGFIIAIIPVVKEYNITINKPVDGTNKLRVAAVSDIHLGSIIRKRSITKLSVMLKEMHPDVIFLLGDIVDGELGPVLRDDLLKYFKSPETADGLYAITGNHEFIGGAKRTIPYIESKGIRNLKDEVVILPGGIQVVGRIDRDSRRFYGKERMPLEELMKGIDHSRPIILLDHQPYHLDETEKYGIDLQLSGHTHNGQMWPLNYLTRRIYELSYGYLKKGNSQIIVSSGFGLWGPRVRLGSRSEVLLINIEFTGGRRKDQ